MPRGGESKFSPQDNFNIGYSPTWEDNKTMIRFHQSNALIRGIQGPFRSGKSTGCCWEIFKRATEQEIGTNGKAQTKWVIIRDTYDNLKRNVLRTWLEWFPENIVGKMNWDEPYTQRINFNYRKVEKSGVATIKPIEMEMIFLALAAPEDAKKLGSFEVTGAYINEARDIPKEVFDVLQGRIRQYPHQMNRPAHISKDNWPTWGGIIMDTNPPNFGHWWEVFFEHTCKDDPTISAQVFYQPSGLSEERENKRFLHSAYYTDLAKGKEEWFIRTMIEGKYGYSRSGKPVFTNYKDEKHVAKETIKPNRFMPLFVGLDFGLNCSAVFVQLDPRGRLVVLDELISNKGIKEFIRTMLKPALNTKYNGFRVKVIGDPAGRARVQTNESTCYDELSMAGLDAEAAKTNAIIPRIDSINYYLTLEVEGQPAFQLNPCCHTLREGFNDKYRYRKIRTLGGDSYDDEPEKSHPWSDIMDALQYICMHLLDDTPKHRDRPMTVPKISREVFF